MGERGGINLDEAFSNNPVNRQDTLGMSLTESQCQNALGNFYRLNPAWKAMVDFWDQQAGEKRCTLNPVCGCCGTGKYGECRRVVSQPYRQYDLTLCTDKADEANIYLTIAHELTHFVTGCADSGESPCQKESGQDFFDCSCSQYLCREMQAFATSGQCRNMDDCWALVVSGGYLNDAPCRAAAPYSAPTRSRVLKYMHNCKKVGLPLPNYPHVLPIL